MKPLALCWGFLSGAWLAVASVLAAGEEAVDPAVENSAPKVVLEWKARGEAGVYGYLVYRALRRQGPYVRCSGEIVHRRSSNDKEEASYSFVDTDVDPGRTYFYYLDVVSTAGRKQRFSGVASKRVPESVAQEARSLPE